MDEEKKVVDMQDIRVGQYADYWRYDPDGITGEPTPVDTELENRLFGKAVMDVLRKVRSNG
jgi:hypothetical protein